MRQMRMAITLVLAITVAAPAMALTVKNSDTKEQSIAVDTGSYEAVYKIAPGAAVDVNVDCTRGCAVTGPWGYSRTATVDDVIETDGKSLVTTTKAVKWTNTKSATNALAGKAAVTSLTTDSKASARPAQKRKHAHKAKQHKKVAQKAKTNSPYFRGSFASLLTGRVDR